MNDCHRHTSRRPLRLTCATLLAIGLPWVGANAAAAAWQSGGSVDNPQSREQASLVEEQELLARKLARVVSSMNRLADRFEAEGRVHAAKLLRDGLSHISVRHEATDGLTLAERMDGSHEKLAAGQSMQSIETQQQIIGELEALISILMDRPDLDQIENEIEKLNRQKRELQSIANAEEELRQATEQLREDASNEAQKSLEEGISEALKKQRELLSENERLSRQSGSLDLERIEEDLAELLSDQQADAEVLQDWDPAGSEPLEALLPQLEAARKASARADRMQAAAESLSEASRDDDNAARSRSVAEEAESARRAARASGDEGAEEVAKALEQAADALRTAGEDAESQAQAAEKVAELARELERQTEATRQAAAQAREAAREGLKALESGPNARTSQMAKDLNEGFEQAEDQGAEEARRATDLAHREVRNALEQTKFMGQALKNSQEQNAERAETLREGIERLPQDLGEEGSAAQEALAEARDAMQEAAESAEAGEPTASQESAQRAAEALERAQSALRQSREQGAQSPGSESAQRNAELAAAQEELAQQTKDMQAQAQAGSMGEEAQAEVEQALQEAAEAMQQAAESMQQGKSASAASSQRQASEALQSAAKAASEGIEPQTEEEQARAEELAKEQERIAKELYEFRQKFEEERDENSPSMNSLSKAQSSASQAQQSLEQGELDQASEQEEQTQQELEQALAELEQKEEQYQKLRDEELLFQIAEEVTAILAAHEASTLETLEVDRGRKPGSSASRGQKLRLRKISRNESALAKRASEIREAISAEGSLVFAELIERIERDLGSVARQLGQEGNYQSGDRVQALQADVTHYLGWLQQALEEEQERREEEKQQPPAPGGEPPPDGENRLVPDIAELKLLGRMEVDVLDGIEELIVLYPELAEGTEVDPLLLEEIQRLAHRHERSTELFQQFRERLGIQAPALDMGANQVHTSGSEGDENDTEE